MSKNSNAKKSNKAAIPEDKMIQSKKAAMAIGESINSDLINNTKKNDLNQRVEESTKSHQFAQDKSKEREVNAEIKNRDPKDDKIKKAVEEIKDPQTKQQTQTVVKEETTKLEQQTVQARGGFLTTVNNQISREDIIKSRNDTQNFKDLRNSLPKLAQRDIAKRVEAARMSPRDLVDSIRKETSVTSNTAQDHSTRSAPNKDRGKGPSIG